jgi:hypothetical protein
MRIDLPNSVMAILRKKETPQAVREAVAALWTEPRSPDAMPVTGRPDTYQIFESGYWSVYEVKLDRSETVVRVLDIDQN